jgi:adenylyl-sulfate kinase
MTSNIIWQKHIVKRKDREKLNGHGGFVLWFTGLSGSGKSTIAGLLEAELHKKKFHTYLMDGDNIRHRLNTDLGFSDFDRNENIRRTAEVARLFADAGLITIVPFISPFRDGRQYAKEIIGDDDFVEVFIDAPLHDCAARDAKGWYKKAFNGEIDNYTGVDSPYEKPLSADVHIKTPNICFKDAVRKIIDYIKKNGLLNL